MVIDVASKYGVVAGKDNTTKLMKMRTALAGSGKPHYVLHFPAGVIKYTNNRWLFGIRSFELVGEGTILQSIYEGSDDAFQRPLFVGELLQNNALTYIGTKDYETPDKFKSAAAGSLVIELEAKTNLYNIGDRILLYADNYATTGYPPPSLPEIHEIQSISGNFLTLKRPLEKTYSTDIWDNPEISGGGSGLPRVLNLDRTENVYCKYARFVGVRFANATGGGEGNVVFPAERLEMVGCKADGWFWPSETKVAVYEDMEVNNVEFDKLADTVICNRVRFNGSPINGGSINRVVLEGCQSGSIRLCPRVLEISNTTLWANSVPTGPSTFDYAIPCLADAPAKNPIRSLYIKNLTLTSGAQSTATTNIEFAPFSSLSVGAVNGTSIVTASAETVQTIEPGTTVMFKEDGTKGGLVTSITFSSGTFKIAGNWVLPVVGETWRWCYIKDVIDLGGHRVLNSGKVFWGGQSIRWKGNSSSSSVKTMKLNQSDFKWVNGGNGNRTIDLYGWLVSAEIIVSKAYTGTAASISMENVDPYSSLFTINTKNLGITNPSLPLTWVKQLTLNTFSITGPVTPDSLPEFDITIRWKPHTT